MKCDKDRGERVSGEGPRSGLEGSCRQNVRPSAVATIRFEVSLLCNCAADDYEPLGLARRLSVARTTGTVSLKPGSKAHALISVYKKLISIYITVYTCLRS